MDDNDSFEFEQKLLEQDLIVVDEFILELHREAVETQELYNQHKVQSMTYREGYESAIALLQKLDPDMISSDLEALLQESTN